MSVMHKVKLEMCEFTGAALSGGRPLICGTIAQLLDLKPGYSTVWVWDEPASSDWKVELVPDLPVVSECGSGEGVRLTFWDDTIIVQAYYPQERVARLKGLLASLSLSPTAPIYISVRKDEANAEQPTA